MRLDYSCAGGFSAAQAVRLNENETVRLNFNLDDLCGQDGNLCGSDYLLNKKWDFDFLFFQKVCGSKILKQKITRLGRAKGKAKGNASRLNESLKEKFFQLRKITRFFAVRAPKRAFWRYV